MADRAPLSSLFALVGAAAIAVFTYGASQNAAELPWSMWLVVVWSYALAAALVIWALRDYLDIHWIGNPTLSMVAGASGSALAAVALAFSFSATKSQDLTQKNQQELMEAQLQSMQRIEVELKNIKESLKTAEKL